MGKRQKDGKLLCGTTKYEIERELLNLAIALTGREVIASANDFPSGLLSKTHGCLVRVS